MQADDILSSQSKECFLYFLWLYLRKNHPSWWSGGRFGPKTKVFQSYFYMVNKAMGVLGLLRLIKRCMY